MYSENAAGALVVIDAVHAEQQRVSGRKLVAMGQGPWRERLWQVDVSCGAAVAVQLSWKQLLCNVELEQGKLSGGSIDAMKKVGVVV